MNGWLDYALFSLAAWRLASLLVAEDGPGAMFARLRKRAGISTVAVRQPDGSLQVGKTARTSLAEGLMCVWCTSIWMAFVLVGGEFLYRSFFRDTLTIAGVFIAMWQIIRDTLVVSALAIGWHEAIERIRK